MLNTESALARLVDESTIRKMTARFADAGTRADYEGFRGLWSSDAVWQIGKPAETSARGLEEIMALFHTLRDAKAYFVQFALQGPIEIQGDDASSRVLVYESAKGSSQSYYRTHGIYTDRLRRSGDGWTFTRRSWAYLWLDTAPFGGEAFRLEEVLPR